MSTKAEMISGRGLVEVIGALRRAQSELVLLNQYLHDPLLRPLMRRIQEWEDILECSLRTMRHDINAKHPLPDGPPLHKEPCRSDLPMGGCSLCRGIEEMCRG